MEITVKTLKEMVENAQKYSQQKTTKTADGSYEEPKNFVTKKEIQAIQRQGDIEFFKRISQIAVLDKVCTFERALTKTNKEKEAVKSFVRFCENFENIKPKGAGIYIVGNSGTGKTFYTNCIYNTLKDKYAVYKTTLKAILDIKLSNIKDKNAGLDIISTLSKAELVILDDLGNESLSEWGKQETFELFDYLYKNKISFIVNTNLTNSQMREFLSIKQSDKILSRIKSRCKSYVFDWEDKIADECKKIWEDFF